MSNKDAIAFTCENARCGCVLYAEAEQAHHVVKCSKCGHKTLVPDPLGLKLDDKYLWELPFRERMVRGARVVWEGWLRLVERVPAGGLVLLGTIAFMGVWLIVAAPSVPLNFGAVLDEIASVGEIHRVPLSNHDGSRLLYARTTERGLGVYLFEAGTRGAGRGAREGTGTNHGGHEGVGLP